jgi:hypothetical protein
MSANLSSEDGNRSIFRNSLLSSIQGDAQIQKIHQSCVELNNVIKLEVVGREESRRGKRNCFQNFAENNSPVAPIKVHMKAQDHTKGHIFKSLKP